MRLGELCAGYNGLGMAVEEVFGATPAWFSEYDAAPSKILAHHYPDVPNYGDMTAIDWAAIEHADIISGGTPCQDLSAAGRRKGMTEGTRSNLWVNMREAIAIQRPKYVVWENVRGAYSARAYSELEKVGNGHESCVCGGTGRRGRLHSSGRDEGEVVPASGQRRDDGTGTTSTDLVEGRMGWDALSTPQADREMGGGLDLAPDRSSSGGTSDGDSAFPTLEDGAGGRGAGTECASASPAEDGKRASSMEPDSASRVRRDTGTDEGNEQEGTSCRCKECGGCVDEANCDLEQCTGCLGDPTDGGAVLRALGRVLGDLSDLGYDCQWRGLRAADVGAPHGRYRVFVLAANRDSLRSHRRGQRAREDRRGQLANGSDATPEPKSIRGREGRAEYARQQRRLDAIQRSSPTFTNANSGDDSRREQDPERGEERGTTSEWSSGSNIDWGQYEPAIRRWEALRGTAPAPTELTARGSHRLSARFAEWLMGVPAGWITDVPGISRNDQLKACGNGVVPQQATAALRDMFAAFNLQETP